MANGQRVNKRAAHYMRLSTTEETSDEVTAKHSSEGTGNEHPSCMTVCLLAVPNKKVVKAATELEVLQRKEAMAQRYIGVKLGLWKDATSRYYEASSSRLSPSIGGPGTGGGGWW